MKNYYVIFFDERNKKLCGTWKRAENAEHACLRAEFALIFSYPNIKYTSCKVVNIAD